MATEAVVSNISPPPNGAAIAQTQDHLAASQWYTAQQVIERVQLVNQIFRTLMKEGVHFGTIPGCDKPSLYKPGSELLLMAFRIAITPKVQDLSSEDCARYRVTTEATHAPTGLYLGAGIGECSTDETKYKWRKARCVDEYETTDVGRRQIVWKSGQRAAYSEMQVRANMADVANTALKISKKRSQIDLALTVLGCSDMFTQDVEDMDLPLENEGTGEPAPSKPPQPQPVVRMPQRKQATAQRNTQPQPQPAPLQPRSYAEPARRTPLQESNARQPARAPLGEKITDGQDKRFFAIAMGNGITKPEIRAYLEQTWGVSNSKDLVKGSCYEAAVAWAEGK